MDGDIHHFKDGEVVLYRRNVSPLWQARFKNPDGGGWIRKSTKQRDKTIASEWACDYYDEIRFKSKHGMAAVTRTFAQVVRQYLTDLEADIDAGVRNPAQRKQYGFVVDLYLLPYFGKMGIDGIGLPELTKYQQWRDKKAGRRLTGSTIQSHNAVLRGIFKAALRHGWLKEHQVPEFRNDKVQSKRRPAFTLDEYKGLYRFMRKWHRTGKKQRTRDIRALMRDYVLILANSGMRPGTETDSLCWRNIEEFRLPQAAISPSKRRRRLTMCVRRFGITSRNAVVCGCGSATRKPPAKTVQPIDIKRTLVRWRGSPSAPIHTPPLVKTKTRGYLSASDR